MKEKIGVGIVTCNRPDFLEKLIESVKDCDYIDEFVIVNDGSPLPDIDIPFAHTLLQNKTNLNVGASKNRLMQHLLDRGCDYIFTLEDDIIIKDTNIFKEYIKASKETGLQHFNFGFSQRENLSKDLKPVYRKVIDYGNDIKLVLTKNILGACTFYTRNALANVGMHHYKFDKGHGDHLELTYRAFKHGYGTPFWWFADIYDSWNKIENQSNFTTDSVVRSENFASKFSEARDTFKFLHGCDIFEVEELSEESVIDLLKNIKQKNAITKQ
jgi:GT2 family glycosyltransferase